MIKKIRDLFSNESKKEAKTIEPIPSQSGEEELPEAKEKRPPGKDLLQQYLDHLSAEHGHLKLKGLLHGHIPRVSVSTIYVALKAVAGEGHLEERRLFLDKLEREKEKALKEESKTSTSFLDEKFYLGEEKLQHKLDVFSLFQEFPRLAIVGEPGSGKTTLLEFLLLQLINNPARFQNRVPLFITLRDLAVYDLPGPENLSGICIPDSLRNILPGDYFQEYLKKGECVLFFDGLDEITDVEERRRVSRWIDDLAERLPSNHFIVTSRIIGYREAPLHKGFHQFRLCDFDKEDTGEFVFMWQNSVEPLGDKEGEDARRLRISKNVERLLKIMERNKGIRHLASNPLLLTIILLVYNSLARLPEERGLLYEACVNVLLEHLQKSRLEDSKHGAFKATQGIKLDQQRDLLKSMAFWLHSRGKREEDQERVCGDLLRPQFPFIGLNESGAEPFIREVEERSGLVVHRGAGIGFSHLTFQEYLTSLELCDREDQQEVVEFLVERSLQSWWREVIQLYAASVVNAAALIRRLMDEKDTELHHLLLLSGACLADAKKVKDVHLRQRMIERLADLYQQSPFTYLRFQARQVLVRIGTEEVVRLFQERLEQNFDDPIAVRDSVEILSRLHVGTDVLRLLMNLLQREDLPESVRQSVLRGLANVDKCTGELEDLLLTCMDTEYPMPTRKEALLTLASLCPFPRINERIHKDFFKNRENENPLDDLFVVAAKGFIKTMPWETALDVLKKKMDISGGAEYKVELNRAVTFVKAPEEKIKNLLVDLLHHGIDWGARGGAALALGLLKEDRPDIGRQLAKRLSVEKDKGVTIRIAEALRGLGWHEPGLLETIKKSMEKERHFQTHWKLAAAYAQLTRDEEFILDKLVKTATAVAGVTEEERIQAITILNQIEFYLEGTTRGLIESLPTLDRGEAQACLSYLSNAPSIPEDVQGKLEAYLRNTMNNPKLDRVLRNNAFETLYSFYDLFMGTAIERPKPISPPKFPVGISDFERIIEEDYFYLDKSLLIQEICDEDSLVLLFPRPRRFGKTLNMSMLKHFFEKSKKNKAKLFSKLDISKHGKSMESMGRYPVVFLSFKDVKQNTWEHCLESIQQVIAAEFNRHGDVRDSLSPRERDAFDRILKGDAAFVEYEQSLKKLTEWLHRHHGSRVMVLIDEYDMPLERAFEKHYYEEAVTFFRNFFSGALKDNPSLEKGILTGILRIAMESIFSGLNNLAVFSILNEPFADKFGLTEKEVTQALGAFDLASNTAMVREWYDGYLFGNKRIYNPWSIINYLSHKKIDPYWTNTSEDSMIQKLLIQEDTAVQEDAAILLNGESISITLDENIIFSHIERTSDSIWNFLVFTGYLAIQAPEGEKENRRYKVAIPNKEVRLAFTRTFSDWFNPYKVQTTLKEMLAALKQGDVEEFGISLRKIVERVMSFHDTAGKNTEQVYHVFVLGMVTNLEEYFEVNSNGEAGFGRYDIMLTPKSDVSPGIVIEFKKIKDAEKEDKVLAEALEQIREKDYAQKLRDKGIKRILGIGVVFHGKRVKVGKVEL